MFAFDVFFPRKNIAPEFQSAIASRDDTKKKGGFKECFFYPYFFPSFPMEVSFFLGEVMFGLNQKIVSTDCHKCSLCGNMMSGTKIFSWVVTPRHVCDGEKDPKRYSI